MNLSEPIVMGILNITPDSFYDGGQYLQEHHALQRVGQMVDEGAAIIDVGAASTRPGASLESSQTEIRRLQPVLKAIIRAFPQVVLSVDTYNAPTARMALDEGAHIINDISAGSFDQQMFGTIAEYQVPYIIMHTVGTPEVMQKNPSYEDVTKEVAFFFSQKLFQLNQLGVHDIIIDPGFGFAKSMEHNYQLLQNLDFFRIFDLPVLAGVSRKGMIHKALKVKPEESLNGTTVVNTMALLKGASILRVHDVKAAVEAVKICNLYQSQADF